MRFTLEIELGNEAMQTADDVAEALERTARQLRHLDHGEFAIFDLNGNKVGAWDMPDAPAVVSQEAEEARYKQRIADAAAGDPGELEEHKYLLPRDEA